MTTHLVQFSTGKGSAEVAWRVVNGIAAPGDAVVLLAADTLVEDEDNWRFGYEVAERLGLTITRLADGRTPMQVGRDERVVPNNRLAVCSRVLKRDLLRKHMETHFDPETSIVYLGFGWDELHRLDRARPHWVPWTIDAPLTRPPFLGHQEGLDLWRSRGIEPPRLYDLGWSHANCGGACVRAGQSQWKHLLDKRPEVYAQWEAEEEATRNYLGKDVAILREQRNNVRRPLPLRVLRERIEADASNYNAHDAWACSCTETMEGD